MTVKYLPLIACVVASGAAYAEPSLVVLERGDAIEVIAHEVTAARTAVTPTRSRLEVELVGGPLARALYPGSETGIKVIELTNAAPRVLSIKLALERDPVRQLARHAQAIQVGPDLHVLFPRAVPAEGAVAQLPEPTIPAALAAKVGPPAPPPAAPPQSASKNAAAASAASKPTSSPTTSSTTAAAPATTATNLAAPPPSEQPNPTANSNPSHPAKAPLESSRDPAATNWPLLGLFGACAIALGAWLVRRKRATREPASSIEVIAQRSLGSKARVVWLSAGGREMVVAVTPQQVRVLGQWQRDEAPTNSTAANFADHFANSGSFASRAPNDAPAFASGSSRLPTVRPPTHADPASSPVAGILRLRARTQAPELSDEVATGDFEADTLWAKEIIAATAGARR